MLKHPLLFIRTQFSKHRNAFSRLSGRSLSPKSIGAFGWSLLAIPVSTFALGTWQVRRKTWKENLIQDLRNRVETPPKSLPDNLDEVEALEYYPIHVKGVYQHDKELYIGPRSLIIAGDAATSSSLISTEQNKNLGFLVITPLKLSNRDETILINRGWVPTKYKNPHSRLKGQVEGEVNVIGVVRLHENRPNFMPAMKANHDVFLYRDLELMSIETGASPVYLDATTEFPIVDGPIGGQTRITLRNEHLSYIITWYSLSAITSYMWTKQFIKK